MNRKPRPISPSTSAKVRVFRTDPGCEVLGPGRRAVIWVQGCTLACKGCLVPRSWPAQGPERSVAELADWILQLPDIEGITLSGGEPFQQAEALATLVTEVRRQRDLGVVCYTGYALADLAGKPLLDQIDLLIDGPYRQAEHADLLWRGSANQRLHYLTGRYSPAPQDVGAGLEFRFDSDGRFAFAGVPPWPGYVQAMP